MDECKTWGEFYCDPVMGEFSNIRRKLEEEEIPLLVEAAYQVVDINGGEEKRYIRFYGKREEVVPGPAATNSGPVHVGYTLLSDDQGEKIEAEKYAGWGYVDIDVAVGARQAVFHPVGVRRIAVRNAEGELLFLG